MRNLFYLISDPRSLRRLLISEPIALGLFVLIAAQVSMSIARFLAISGHGAVWAFLDVVFMTMLTLVCIFLGTAFFHLFATLLGGRGHPGQLFWGLMVSAAPWLLATPGVLVAMGLGAMYPDLYPLFVCAGTCTLAGWSIGLKAYVISTVYGLSGSGGLFVMFVGFGTALILAAVAAFSLGMSGLFTFAWMAGSAAS
jgi:hypothetical protein